MKRKNVLEFLLFIRVFSYVLARGDTKKLILLFYFMINLGHRVYCQNNPCDKLLSEDLKTKYSYDEKVSFNSNVKNFFNSQEFYDYAEGNNFGTTLTDPSGEIPVGVSLTDVYNKNSSFRKSLNSSNEQQTSYDYVKKIYFQITPPTIIDGYLKCLTTTKKGNDIFMEKTKVIPDTNCSLTFTLVPNFNGETSAKKGFKVLKYIVNGGEADELTKKVLKKNSIIKNSTIVNFIKNKKGPFYVQIFLEHNGDIKELYYVASSNICSTSKPSTSVLFITQKKPVILSHIAELTYSLIVIDSGVINIDNSNGVYSSLPINLKLNCQNIIFNNPLFLVGKGAKGLDGSRGRPCDLCTDNFGDNNKGGNCGGANTPDDCSASLSGAQNLRGKRGGDGSQGQPGPIIYLNIQDEIINGLNIIGKNNLLGGDGGKGGGCGPSAWGTCCGGMVRFASCEGSGSTGPLGIEGQIIITLKNFQVE